MSSNDKSSPSKASSPSKKRKRGNQQKAKRETRPSPSAQHAAQSHADGPEWFHPFTQGDPLYVAYMSTEWGHETRADAALFETLSLEGAPSGLSWRTILRKRAAYRREFFGFDVERAAAMTEDDVDRTAGKTSDDPEERVVRHRGKLASVIHNAKVIRRLASDGAIPSFAEYVWSFVDGRPILNRWNSLGDLPSETEESERRSRALKGRGFKFVGPTTCYALMQSCGMVIDHPRGTRHWAEAERRLRSREGGYQIR